MYKQRVPKGAILTDLLTAHGISHGETNKAIRALRAYFDPRRLRAGQTIHTVVAENYLVFVRGHRYILPVRMPPVPGAVPARCRAHHAAELVAQRDRRCVPHERVAAASEDLAARAAKLTLLL